MTMTKEMVKALRAALDGVLTGAPIAEIEKKFGVKIRFGNASYDPTGIATFKMEVSQVTEGGEVMSKEAAALDAICKQMGIKSVRGDIVQFGGKSYQIIGYKTRSPKKPFIVRDGAGKMYILPLDVVKNQVGFLWAWERPGYDFESAVVPAPKGGK
jgi:hypothetical protein